jgi:hypothetical protein
MASDCQMPILDIAILLSTEEGMISAPASAPEAKTMAPWECKSPSHERVPAWEQDAIPRLSVDDLLDPKGFHQRLSDWLMTQK